MATTLTYTVSPYVPFTKILSANINQDKTDIQSRINWAGGTDATTGLGDDNIQSNAASGGGLTRSTKLKAGTAGYVLINDGTGKVSEEATLAITRGGTGLNVVIASHSPGEVLQVNSVGSALELAPPAGVPSSLKIFQFYRFS